jgi:2-polyprenyl-6-hydroxyphenyl methylase / 3-demethylubiquinone-9 3-methyltransferase
MPVDNGIYERHADAWWTEEGPLHGLRTSMNPARLAYFRRTLAAELSRPPRGLRVLDVGCGGGFLAEPFAQLGCVVTGVDPSPASIAAAAAHAGEQGLDIDYRVGRGEALPVADASFDVVCCCDVLEHVDDVAATVREMARALAPGGVLLYDTINRTFASRLVVIKLMQEWAWSRFVPPDLHDWTRFVTPAELDAELRAAGLAPRAPVGLAPSVGPIAMVRALRDHKAGRITVAELGRRTTLREVASTAVGYMGCARKPRGPS